MQPKTCFAFLSVLCLAFACALPAIAGPPFPCVRGVSSKNGNFLVLADQYVPGQAGVSLQVFRKENFINASQRLAAPATYWRGQVWGVALDADPMHNEPEPCPLPLITDDGDFLILVHVGPAFSNDKGPVLRTYRRRDHPGDPEVDTLPVAINTTVLREGPDHGVFIKDIALTEIWTPDQLAANPTFWTDHTPEWFSGGTFEFSSDSRQLIHKTRWGNTVRINLQDGSLSKN